MNSAPAIKGSPSGRVKSRPRLSEEVVADLATQILSGQLPPGAMLPIELELATIYNVSRTVVRDAVAQLRRQGLVQVRQGIGTIVLPRDDWNDLDPGLLQVRVKAGLFGDLVKDLLEIRRMIEVEVAGHAALRRSEEDLDRLSNLLKEMETETQDAMTFVESDIRFHEALLFATGNRLLRQFMHNVNQLRRIGSILNTTSNPENIVASMAGHREIYAAVAAGDDVAAKAAMMEHLLRFEHDISEALTANE